MKGHKQIFVYIINADWYFELHWLQRALATLNKGFDVHIILPFSDETIINKLKTLGFVCHNWNINRKSINLLNNIVELINLNSLIKSISPNIIHSITLKPNLYLGLIAHTLNIPYILSVTGTGFIFSSQSFKTKLLKPVIKFFFKSLKKGKNSRKIIFENNEDSNLFINEGLCKINESIVILGAGVDTEVYKPKEEPITDKPIILFAGRLLWDKGLGDLIDAAKLMRKRGLDFTIYVAGILDQSSINAIDERVLVEWNNQGLISWLGKQKNMQNLINQANIIVLPTFYGEGIPRILIEAASCQRAIVTTNIPGCREIVKNGTNGILVTPRNIYELSDALSLLIKSPQLRTEMGLNGRKMVEQYFSDEIVIKKTLDLYEELLNKNRIN